MIQVNGFYQSIELDGIEQKYYTFARQKIKEEGMAKFQRYIAWMERKDEYPRILLVTPGRFIELMQLALKDYLTIILSN